MRAVIVPRRSCLIYFLFCQANKFIYSFIHSMLSGYVKFDVILTDKTDNIFIDGNQKISISVTVEENGNEDCVKNAI